MCSKPYFKITTLFLVLIYIFNPLDAQDWSVTQAKNMPSPVSNNAVCGVSVNNEFRVYSFSGIDTGKDFSGISLQSYRYIEHLDQWDTIQPLPGGLPRIAASASTVGTKIYIIGGYHVAANGNETSLSNVHVYTPASDQYEANGSNTIIPIDDHVHGVWRDSLIYIVSGWSNTANVSAVQIYNPSSDSWMNGTALPGVNYRVFGASGLIIGDTIYYIGGAGNWNGNTFPIISEVRRGVIDKADPSQISWESFPDTLAGIYRAAAFEFQGKAHWIGGSLNSYNYDGIAYDGSGLVPGSKRLVYFDPQTENLRSYDIEFPFMMDLRGIAYNGENKWFIAGGMDSSANVTSKTHVISHDIQSGLTAPRPNTSLKWKIVNAESHITLISEEIEPGQKYFCMDITGKLVRKGELKDKEQIIPTSGMDNGMYFIMVLNESNSVRACLKFVK